MEEINIFPWVKTTYYIFIIQLIIVLKFYLMI